MKSLEEQIRLYNEYHKMRFAKLTHVIGIPFITIAALMLLSWLSIDFAAYWRVSFSWLLVVSVLFYYLFLNWKMGCATAVILLPITFALTTLVGSKPNIVTVAICLALFIMGYILLYFGHRREEVHVKFPVNLYHFIVAPLFLIIDLLKVLGLRKYFL